MSFISAEREEQKLNYSENRKSSLVHLQFRIYIKQTGIKRGREREREIHILLVSTSLLAELGELCRGRRHQHVTIVTTDTVTETK